MRVYGVLLGALLGTAVVTTSVGAASANPSTITSVDVARVRPVGSYAGLTFRSIEGTVYGEISAEEPIAGLRELAAGRPTVPYQVSFHLIAPEGASEADTVVVEAPNRGRTIFPGAISIPARVAGPSADPVANAIGDAFLLSHRISIAAIQWQTGFAARVPQSAQGIGEVVARDFGRWLGGAFRNGPHALPIFRHRILAGVSQAAWFVNSFTAEGFNVDPETGHGVYQGVFTRNGNGVVLAINGFAAHEQFPYARADLAPLMPGELLSRPASDPELVDVISLTDFYRLRASLSARAPAPPGMHRYATAAPHASGGAALPEVVFGAMKCNGGTPISLSAVRDALYLRPLILGLSASIGGGETAKRLPPDAPFILNAVPAELEGVNRLDGTALWTPKSAPNGMPLGGIPMLEASLPIGLPRPIALPPVEIASINDTCGNFSGWEAFSVDELTRRYGDRARYIEMARQKTTDLVAAGYLLEEDEAAAIREIEAQLPENFR
jgi:Alpha/beta hydrolase domain